MKRLSGLITLLVLFLSPAFAEEASPALSSSKEDSLKNFFQQGSAVWSLVNKELTAKLVQDGTGFLLTDAVQSDFEISFNWESRGPIEQIGLAFRTGLVDGIPYGYVIPLLGPAADSKPGAVIPTTLINLCSGEASQSDSKESQGSPAAKKTGSLKLSFKDGNISIQKDNNPAQQLVDDRFISGSLGLWISGKAGADVRIFQLGFQDFEPYAGYTSLFNGEDLTGWTIHGLPDEWNVEDGVITGESVGGEYGYLATNNEYRNFSVVADFLGLEGGNSGLFFHSKLDGTAITGIQSEVQPNYGGRSAFLYESGGRGWLIKPEEIHPEQDRVFRPNEWNTMRVDVKDNHIRTWLNGMKITDMQNETPLHDQGLIALQIHSGGGVKVKWQNLRIRAE